MDNFINDYQKLYENSIVVNDTPMNADTLKLFYKPMSILMTVMLVFAPFIIALGIVYITVFDMTFLAGIMFTCALVVICCAIIFFITVRKSVYDNKMLNPYSHTLFFFNEYGFDYILLDDKNITGTQFTAYEQITNVKSGKDIITIKVANVAFIILRNKFTKGTEADLTALLRSKCGNKVKISV